MVSSITSATTSPTRSSTRIPADCPFTGASFGGTFPGLQDLNFGEPITGQFIKEVCRYWIDTFGIDGIRLDNTVNFHIAGDLRGVPEILADVEAHIAAKGEENFSLTLEHLDISAAHGHQRHRRHQLLGRLPLPEDKSLRRAVERPDRQLLPQRPQQPPLPVRREGADAVSEQPRPLPRGLAHRIAGPASARSADGGDCSPT